MNIPGKKGVVGQYLFYLIISVFLLHYVIYRSINVSFTHDESLSYLVNENFSLQVDTVTYHDTEITTNVTSDYVTFLISTNTHLLNSLLMKLIQVAFGDNEFLLRLPNVIAFICYLFFAFKIARLAPNKLLSYAIFSILVFNTYLLDFFSLARGYGLAIMFMTGSTWYLSVSIDNNFILRNRRYFICSYLFAILSVLSNLIWLYFFMAILVICVIILIRNKNAGNASPEPSSIRLKYLFVLMSVVFSVIIVPFILILYYFNQFYFGSDIVGPDALISLCTRWLYSDALAAYASLLAIAVSLLFLTLLVYLAGSLRKRISRYYLPVIILLMILIESVILNMAMGIPFLQDRTAMIFIPLFQLGLIFLSVDAARLNHFPLLNKAILFSAGAVSLIAFVCSFNYTNTFEWKHEATTEDAFHKIAGSSGTGDSIIILTNWQNVPSFNYYRLSGNAETISKIQYRELSSLPDFVYLNKGDTLSLPHGNYELLKNYPASESKLYRLRK